MNNKNVLKPPPQGKIIAEAFAGPLPHPNDFERYEKIQPGAADRILKMAENEQSHRHQIEKNESEAFIKLFSRGQIFAFIFGLVGILCGATLLAFNKDIAGYVILIGSIGTIIGKYLYESKQSRDEIDSQDKISKE